MKKITMFTMASCPYCRVAHRWMKQVLQNNLEYKDITLEIIDEVMHPQIANNYDYWFVPTYYIEDEKVHEGAASKKIIKKIFEQAYK